MYLEIPEPIVLFISLFLQYALPPLLVALLAWIAPKAISAWMNLKADRPDIAAVLENAARIAVLAAEQSQLSGYIQDKKQFAVQYIQNLLAQQGLGGINVAAIEGAVEAAVWDELNRYLTPEEIEAKRSAHTALPSKKS